MRRACGGGAMTSTGSEEAIAGGLVVPGVVPICLTETEAWGRPTNESTSNFLRN
jgi:hypothetical protein